MGQNPYQKRSVSLQEVVQRIRFSQNETESKILLSVSPCRSGTTVLLRVFGAVGIQAHYQELKNIFRWRMQAEEFCWDFPDNQGIVYLKETLGPYTLAEAQFNPLDVLLKAGVSPENLKVFIVGRSPLETWISWASWWRPATSIDIFIHAYQTTDAIRQQAHEAGLLAATFVYDAIRDVGAEAAIQRLFEKLDLSFAPIAVRGWQNLPPFGDAGSNVFLPEEPPVFEVPNLHANVEKADNLSHYQRSRKFCDEYPAECKALHESNVFTIYKQWRAACEKDLDIVVQPANH
jgi:hypothetical protein